MLIWLKGFFVCCCELKELDVFVVSWFWLVLVELVQVDVCEVVWCVLVFGQVDCFMLVKFGVINDEMFVVWVDIEVFYWVWLCSSLMGCEMWLDNCLLCLEMLQDYKFKYVVQGFVYGRENFVLLVFVGVYQECYWVDIGFSNGVMCLFWLIVNKVLLFLIQVYGWELVELLNKVCGFDFVLLLFMELFVQV